MFIMLPFSQRALILVLEPDVGNFGLRLPPGCSRQCTLFVCSDFKLLCDKITSASKMFAANLGNLYVASVLCCHCWMFSLSDALPMQSYPSKV